MSTDLKCAAALLLLQGLLTFYVVHDVYGSPSIQDRGPTRGQCELYLAPSKGMALMGQPSTYTLITISFVEQYLGLAFLRGEILRMALPWTRK